MATNKQSGNQGNSQGGGSVEPSLESIRRLNIAGITFESTSGEGNDIVKISAGGIKEQQLNEEDIGQLASFFGRLARGLGRNDDGPRATDGRGQVNHPESDARLKGNEHLRQNDPDRSGSNGYSGPGGPGGNKGRQ